MLAIAAFAGAVTLGLLLVGPFALRHVLFGQHFTYNRFGLALIGIGMGFHLASGALNQAALARDRAREATACWALAAAAFLGWMFLPVPRRTAAAHGGRLCGRDAAAPRGPDRALSSRAARRATPAR